jgi:hypothetical protein
MTRRAVDYLRHHAIAITALACSMLALAGASYAALNIPAGSIGARELRNHSITPVKFDPRAINASIRYWATIDPNGRVLASRPKARALGWAAGRGQVSWGQRIPNNCFSFATVDGFSLPAGQQFGFASTTIGGSGVVVFTADASATSAPKRVNVLVLCP